MKIYIYIHINNLIKNCIIIISFVCVQCIELVHIYIYIYIYMYICIYVYCINAATSIYFLG